MPKAQKGARRPDSGEQKLDFSATDDLNTQQEDREQPMRGDIIPPNGEPEDDDAPTFALVRESGIDGERRALFVVLESTEGDQYRLDFTPGCIPMVVAALSAELGFLMRQQQGDAALAVQPIIAEAIQLGETATGAPALLAEMEGGGELPLQTSLTELRKLARQIDDYIRAKAWDKSSL